MAQIYRPSRMESLGQRLNFFEAALAKNSRSLWYVTCVDATRIWSRQIARLLCYNSGVEDECYGMERTGRIVGTIGGGG